MPSSMPSWMASWTQRAKSAARAHPIWFSAAVLYAVVFLIANAFALDTAGSTAHFDRHIEKAGAQTFVVLVPGMFGNADRLTDLQALVQTTIPNADILVPSYAANPFSNADPKMLASDIEAEIERSVRQHGYKHVVLVGYSLGALIARQVYLYGAGGEPAIGRPGTKGIPARSQWVSRVDRIVLLAGMNRGWTVNRYDEPNTKPLGFGTWLAYSAGKVIGRFTGTGGLAMSSERGAPFVADLRVDWLRLFRESKAPGSAIGPVPVVQLLGDNDDIVSVYDNADVTAAPGFYFIPVTRTGHPDIVDLHDSERGPERRDKITLALTGSMNDLAPYRSVVREVDPRVKRVVFIMHGIRDYGDWTRTVQANIEQHNVGVDSIKVVHDSYGYFPMARFLLFGARQKNVRWFMDKYTEAMAAWPNATVDYVGHSNGTYLLASALAQYRSLRVRNVFFAGSVVPMKYNWANRTGAPQQVSMVRNVTATNDWVVAIFPHLFELIRGMATGLTSFDIGGAGFRGFNDPVDANVKWVVGPHSAAIDASDPAKMKAIANYIVDSDPAALHVFEQANGPAGWIDLLSKICWLVWAVLIALIVYVGMRIGRWGQSRLAVSRGAVSTFVLHRAGWIYGIVIVGLLYSI